MEKLLRKLMVLGMLGIFTVGASVPGFAQGRGRDKRPPKDPGKVVTPGNKGGGNPPQRPPDNKPPKQDKKGKGRP
jgi:hypothetical protein